MPSAGQRPHNCCSLPVRLIAHGHKDALAATPLRSIVLSSSSQRGRGGKARRQCVPIPLRPPSRGATRIQGPATAREQSAQKWFAGSSTALPRAIASRSNIRSCLDLSIYPSCLVRKEKAHRFGRRLVVTLIVTSPVERQMHQKFTVACIQMMNTGTTGIIAVAHHLADRHWTGLKAWMRLTEILWAGPYWIV